MERVVLKSKVSKDGVLHLDVPVGVQEAGKEVHVTVESHVQCKHYGVLAALKMIQPY